MKSKLTTLLPILVLMLSFSISGRAFAAATPNRHVVRGFLQNGFNTSLYQQQPPSQEATNNEAEPQKVVYLTFDDGPDPDWTPLILDVLDWYHAGATFYMVGRNANTYPELVRLVAEHNQSIAVHGYNHMDLSAVDYGTFFLEINDSEEAIRKALQTEPNLEAQYGMCLRPPYGSTSDRLYNHALRMDYSVSMWNIDTKDWQQPAPDEMLAELIKRLEPGKVILMHDGGVDRQATLEGLQLILHELIMQGYQILPYCTSEGQAIDIP